MKDQLEEFIRGNRDAFDDKEPGRNVWSAIDRALFGSSGSLWNSVVLWRAAAIVFMAVSVALLIPEIQNREQNTLAMKEFRDVESFYFQQISQKVNMIENFDGNEGLNGFTHDFQRLDAMYLVLKEEMKVRPSKKVRDALVLNLLVRIDLLNQQLHKLETVDEQVKEGSMVKS